ncbi:MAG: DNA-binding response regulator [Epsilonproteobacteria bacterium]|nr:MAG: DNA-binding response regulator [Campylobacterota bacterium]
MKIFIVEDDKKIALFLKKGLQEEFYSVDISNNAEEAIYLVQTNRYDLIILDIMLPKLNGIELCKIIRQKNIDTPIIMLTAKNSIENKVEGLNEGANDYLTKPFSFDELLARIKVQLRINKSLTNRLKIADLELDCDTLEAKRADIKIELTSKEYSLLEFMMRNKNKVLSVQMINDNIWNIDEITANNIVNVYIYRLRTKIDKIFDLKLIHTIRGVGYKISDKNI